MEYRKFNYKNYKNCYFEVGNYVYNPQSMYIQIRNSEEGDITTVTVNMPDYFYLPETITVKNYSYNCGITKFLKELGIIEEIYTSVKCHPLAAENETIDYCKVNIEKLKEYSKVFNYEWKVG